MSQYYKPGQPYSLGPNIYAGHYALLNYVVGEYRPEGYALEFGVGKGESTRIMAEFMQVIGFDSFQGLPEDWREGYPKGMFAEYEPPNIPNAEFIVGMFEDTLREFPAQEDVGLVHIDCDLYSSTRTALDWLELCDLSGTFIVFDEWHGYEGCEGHEQRAWHEFAKRTGVEWRVIGHSFEQWAIQIH